MSAPTDPIIPEGTLTPETLKQLANAEARARQGIIDDIRPAAEGVGSAFVNGLLGGIADSIRGLLVPAAFTGVKEAYADGQAALIGRLDLLDGVRGYGHAYMTVNVNASWSSTNTRSLPFRGQKGPAKGVTILTDSRGGLRFDEPGAWLIGVKATARGTSYTGSNETTVDLHVHAPNGALVAWSRVRATPGSASASLVDVTAVVIPEAGCTVRVEAWTGRWRWWEGGGGNSALWAIKQDNRTINAGDYDVPDEQQP